MRQTKSRLKLIFVLPEPTLSDKPQLALIIVKVSTRHIRNSPSNYVTPPSRQHRPKPPLLAYLFGAMDKRDVYLWTDHTKLRHTLPSAMLPLLTPYTRCSIPGMMIMGNQQVPWIAPQRNETPQVIADSLLGNIPLNRVRDGKRTCEPGRPEARDLRQE